MTERDGSEKKKKSRKSLKAIRFVFFVVLVFILSGASLVIINQYVVPYLATVKSLNKYKFFQRATDNVVVVNKTEQVTVSEDQSISHYSDKSMSSIVEIVSRRKTSVGGDVTKISGKDQVKIGSGLVVTADGLIITYRDAIFEGQSQYQIIISEKETYEGRLVFADSFTNLAFIKVDGAENLPTASFISPEDIKPGSKIVVIGKNGDNAQIVYKSGLISQLAGDFSIGGPLASSEKLQGVFFADISFDNAGDENIGGATITDYNGDIVGILGYKKTDQTLQHFIITANHIDYLINQYLANGAVKRGSLGIYYLNLSKENAYLADGKHNQGALVFSPSGQQGLAVISGSAAEKAGIRVFDIILSVNDEEISSGQNLAFLISKYKPGDKINIKFVRNGQEMSVDATLE
jgi:serine protease Do